MHASRRGRVPGCGALALAAVAVLASCSTSSKTETPAPTVAPVTSLSNVAPARRPVELRAIKLIVPASRSITPVGGSGQAPQRCATLVTPASEQRPTNPSEMLFDRRRAFCYLLGPTLVTGASIDTSSVVYDAPTLSWAVKVHFKDTTFATKIAQPLVGKQIAVVLAGFVQATPKIKKGASGTELSIVGGFTQDGAIDVASVVLGIAPSKVTVGS